MTSQQAALIAAVLATGMVYLDQTAVNIALPAIQEGLKTDLIGIQWILSIYLLFLTAPLLLCGVLGDRYGRRRLFTFGMMLFGFSSLLSGLAQALTHILIARATQGLGAAMMIAVGIPLLTANTPIASRGKTIGLWVGSSAAIIAAGPSLGGLLVEFGSWRLVFFINLPLALLALVVAYKWLPTDHRADDSYVDWPGMVLLLAGMGSLIFGLIESSRLGFFAPLIWGSVATGVLLLIWFVKYEGKINQPLISPRLFRYPAFRMINLVTLLQWIAVSGVFLFLPLNLQQIQNYSALEAGLSLAPVSFSVLFLSKYSGRWADRYGPDKPMLIGLLCMCIGMSLLASMGRLENYWLDLMPIVSLYGVGLALVVSPLTTVAMTSLPDEHAGVASGVNNSASRIAALLSITLTGSIMLSSFEINFVQELSNLSISDSLYQYLLHEMPNMSQIEIPSSKSLSLALQITSIIDAAYIQGFSIAMYLSAVLTFICLVIVYYHFRK